MGATKDGAVDETVQGTHRLGVVDKKMMRIFSW
jgi:hypothetical protein